MAERRAPVTAPELLLKIVLTGTQSHYESRGLIDEKRLDHLLHAGKQILYKSHQESDVRQNLGFSPAVWEGLTLTLNRAIPVLEQQSFAWKSVSAQHYNGSSSDLIAANYFALVKDIERLNDLCTIARNLLATTRKAQNLAADKAFDQQILKLIDVCVRVTARGFDGETNPRNEERWQKVVNLYKRLLITCLQFLHNFIMHNEQRKLVLWLDLFGTTSAAAQQAQQTEIQAVSDHINLDHRLSTQQDIEYPDGDTIEQEQSISDNTQVDDRAREVDLAAKLQEISNLDLSYNLEDVHALFDLMSADRVLDAAGQEKKRLLMDRIRSDLERISRTTATQLDGDPENLLQVGAKLRELLSVRSADSGRNVLGGASGMANVSRNPLNALPELASYANLTSQEQPITEEDLIMPRTSLSAADTLQEAKDELMARLQDNQPMLDENGKQIYEDELVSQDVLDNDGILDSADESIEEDDEDDDEEDYRSPGDQERGLLTDVPLVLGPTEIEALPMIIQAGIVDNFGVKNGADRQGVRNMQAVRCHILLAQEAGRNVLRELLIFIAAWDLPDDEFYFKMMVQIMESILKNGLMSHAYSDFGQAKDIISPAQAVVIKILTHIFRTKYSPSASTHNGNDQGPPKPRTPAPLSRVDVLTVRYIFTVFRGNIIPETCALIYLQGQIKSGLAVAEDFPLNLWDMERVYEGVYQFLEFFAVLTENNDWKRLLIEWVIVYDLVTLIKELDISISKATLTTTMPPPGKPGKSTARQSSGASNAYARETAINARAAASNLPVSIERPYDPTASPELHPDMHPPPPPPQDDSKPLPPATTEDPSLFEWRNLKKLIILVLSSLVWKSPLVQDQIREHGGVDTVLSCTQYDGHNPYIKEHAVMCLKFLLEGNKENQAIVRELEARGVANGSELERDFGVKPDQIQASVRQAQRQTRQQAQAQAMPPPMPFTAGISSTTSTFPKPSQITRPAADASTPAGNPPIPASASGRRASDANAPSFLGTTSSERIANMAERFNRLDINNLNSARSARLSQQAGQQAQMGHIVDESDGDGDGEGDFDEVEGGSLEFENSGGRFHDVGEMI